MTGKLWTSAAPHDLTGRRGVELERQRREREEAETIQRMRAEGLPGSDQILSHQQIDAAVRSGLLEEGQRIGLTSRGQPVHFFGGEAVVTDARSAAPRAEG